MARHTDSSYLKSFFRPDNTELIHTKWIKGVIFSAVYPRLTAPESMYAVRKLDNLPEPLVFRSHPE